MTNILENVSYILGNADKTFPKYEVVVDNDGFALLERSISEDRSYYNTKFHLFENLKDGKTTGFVYFVFNL